MFLLNLEHNCNALLQPTMPETLHEICKGTFIFVALNIQDIR
jgi:hypothetical protein